MAHWTCYLLAATFLFNPQVGLNPPTCSKDLIHCLKSFWPPDLRIWFFYWWCFLSNKSVWLRTCVCLIHNISRALQEKDKKRKEKLKLVNLNMLIILILMITNFKWFLIKMLELFLNKWEPYKHSNYIHKRWITVKFQIGKWFSAKSGLNCDSGNKRWTVFLLNG